MKIIGEGPGHKIVTMTTGELSNLIGYYYVGDGNCPPLKVGDEIFISSIYMKLYKIQHNKKTTDNAVRELREMADSLELLSPILQVTEAKEEL